MRGWNELVADLADPVPGGVPVLTLLLVVVTSLVAVLWYTWPRWVPRGRAGGAGYRSGRWRRWWGRWWRGVWSWRGWWRGLRRWRLRWPVLRRWRLRWWRRRPHRPPLADLPADEVPEQPAAVLALTADELAARGRYREAVRERLRAIVRDLVERDVIEHRPGWTVTELARMAGAARPATAAPLAAASEVFSRIWYGQQPARAADDLAMREHAARVRAALDTDRVPA